MLGVIVGVMIVWLMYLLYWKVIEEVGVKLGVFFIVLVIKNYFVNFLSEIIGIMVLILGILFIGVNKIVDGLNFLIVGVLIVVIGLSLGGVIGYVINLVCDLGLRIVYVILLIVGKGGLNWLYVIVFILGLIVGGLLGVVVYVVFYKYIFNIGCVIVIVVVIIILILGYILNKLLKKGDIELIY